MSESTTKAERAIEAHHSYKEKGSKSTAREYRRHVTRFYEYLAEQTDVTLWDCHSGHSESFYQHMLQDGYAPSSVRVSHAALMDFYEQVEQFGEEGLRGFPEVSFNRDPTEHAKPERLDGMHKGSKKEVEGGDKPLTRKEVQRLFDNVPAPTVRNQLIVKLMYQTGVRRSELVRIKLDHIDYDEREISIYGKKSEEQRKVWYDSSLDFHLNLWKDGDRNAILTSEESPYLFCTLKSERMAEQTVTNVVTEAAEGAGLQESVYIDKAGQSVNRVGSHTLRKSFGVHFINEGGDISHLMELLGHNQIETTKEHYLKYSDKDLRESVDKNGPSL